MPDAKGTLLFRPLFPDERAMLDRIKLRHANVSLTLLLADDLRVAYTRQGNFTTAALWADGKHLFVGAAKRNPGDPERVDVGQKVTLSKAFRAAPVALIDLTSVVTVSASTANLPLSVTSGAVMLNPDVQRMPNASGVALKDDDMQWAPMDDGPKDARGSDRKSWWTPERRKAQRERMLHSWAKRLAASPRTDGMTSEAHDS